MSCKITYLKRLVKSKLVAVTLLEATGFKEPSPVQQLHTLQRHLEKHVPRKPLQTSLKPHRSLQAVGIELIQSPEHAILPSLHLALTQIRILLPC